MKTILLLLLVSLSHLCYSQNVGIGTTSPHTSAQLDISHASKGILIPRMNTGSIAAIPNPAKGLMVYDSTKNELMVNMGTPAAANWKTIANNSSWNLNGNSGTNPATHFIGTTDNASLLFRIRNKQAGKIDSVSANTFFGYKAGLSTGSGGLFNTAMGYNAFSSNTTGNTNTAVGTSALQSNTTGIQNSAYGVDALKNNTVNNFNVAFGFRSLEHNAGNSNSGFGNATLTFNTTGYANTAIGSNALVFNTTGSLNVAVGRLGMFSNTTGYNNTGVGFSALNGNTTGFYNAALGDAALNSNEDGVGNTACGSGALYNTTNSSYNTTVGYHAGFVFNMGWNNTLIGAESNVNEPDLFNSVALGHNVLITASNQVRIGNSSTSSIGGYTSWTNISDGRYKKDIREDVRGLDFILKLRPVTYHLDVTGLRHKLDEKTEDLEFSGMATAIPEKERMVQSGFIAQEVEQAAQELGYDFSGVDKPKNENDLYGLRYAEFVVPLVKAVQEQQAQLRLLQNENAELRQRLVSIESVFHTSSDQTFKH